MAVGKVAVSVISLILVVGVVIGVVAVVRTHDSDKSEASTSMKTVMSICESTPYKEACARSLEPAAKNQSATVKDYITSAIQATVDELKKSLDVTGKIPVNKDQDPGSYMSVEDCKDLLDEAIQTLQASISMVGDSDMHSLEDRQHELWSWATAVYSLQSSCLEEIDKPEYKTAITNGMINATQLTNNAVNILAELSQVLKVFNITSAGKSTSRKLMTADGYPTWFPTADRKLLAAPGQVTPNAVVAQDGSGQFKTIQDAVNSYPKKFQGRFTIYVKAGLYNEQVLIDKKKANIFIYGDGAGKTVVTNDKNFAFDGLKPSKSATFACDAPGFIARGMTFRNTAGPKGHQAVALRIKGDQSAVFDCRIEGFQDSLYYQAYKQFYRNCIISGTIDFIFGMGDTIIQNSLILVRKPDPNQFNTVTADGRELEKGSNGLVLQNCQILPERDLFPVRFQIATYLGRPWKKNSRTVTMQSELGDFIRPEGYMTWSPQEPNHLTCEYYEFANRGPGANTDRRDRRNFKNFKVLSPNEAAYYTPGIFLKAQDWLPATGIPFQAGL